MAEPFPGRHGYHADEPDITIREIAPEDLRLRSRSLHKMRA